MFLSKLGLRKAFIYSFLHLPQIYIYIVTWKCLYFALTGVAQLVGHCPAKQRVANSIPDWGALPGWWVQLLVGAYARGNQLMFLSHTEVLSLSPSPLLSLKINKILEKNKKEMFIF